MVVARLYYPAAFDGNLAKLVVCLVNLLPVRSYSYRLPKSWYEIWHVCYYVQTKDWHVPRRCIFIWRSGEFPRPVSFSQEQVWRKEGGELCEDDKSVLLEGISRICWGYFGACVTLGMPVRSFRMSGCLCTEQFANSWTAFRDIRCSIILVKCVF